MRYGGILCVLFSFLPIGLARCTHGGPAAEESPSVSVAPEPDREKSLPPANVESRDAIVPAMPTHFSCELDSECLPPPAFAKATCKGRFPGLALNMFQKSTPWKRLYLGQQRLEPVNPHGGSVTEVLQPHEELLLLRRHGSRSGGMTVSGSDVDLLRWDGSCVTIPEEMLSEESGVVGASAAITWRYLDDTTIEALLSADEVKLLHAQQRESCRNSSVSRPDVRCEKSMAALSDRIVAVVRGGMTLPEPAELPAWNIQE